MLLTCVWTSELRAAGALEVVSSFEQSIPASEQPPEATPPSKPIEMRLVGAAFFGGLFLLFGFLTCLVVPELFRRGRRGRPLESDFFHEIPLWAIGLPLGFFLFMVGGTLDGIMLVLERPPLNLVFGKDVPIYLLILKGLALGYGTLGLTVLIGRLTRSVRPLPDTTANGLAAVVEVEPVATTYLACSSCAARVEWGEQACSRCHKAICRGLPAWLDNLIMFAVQIVLAMVLYAFVNPLLKDSTIPQPIRLLLALIIANRMLSGWSIYLEGAHCRLRLTDSLPEIPQNLSSMVWRINYDDWSHHADRTLHDVLRCLNPARDAAQLTEALPALQDLVTRTHPSTAEAIGLPSVVPGSVGQRDSVSRCRSCRTRVLPTREGRCPACGVAFS